jgi:hypothetical protein
MVKDFTNITAIQGDRYLAATVAVATAAGPANSGCALSMSAPLSGL